RVPGGGNRARDHVELLPRASELVRGDDDRPEPVRYDEAVSRLESGLARGLPGEPAQLRLAPRPRQQWPAGHNPARIRLAAGLLLVYASIDRDAGDARARDAAKAHIVLTVRTDTVRHAGQVSLPGGVLDPGETFDQAALREAHEEVALSDDQV